MPAPFNSMNTLENVTPPTQQLTGTKSSASTGAAPPAGPAFIAAHGHTSGTIFHGFGGMLAWSPVPGAVTYRIYRGEVGNFAPVAVHLTVPATDAEGVFAQYTSEGLAVLFDPYFTPTRADVIYWVDATFADGSISNLSGNAFLTHSDALSGYDPANARPGPRNLQAVVGPPTTMPGSTVPARNVTWTWDRNFVLLYEVDVFRVDPSNPINQSLMTTLSLETLLSPGPMDEYGNAVMPGLMSPFSGRGYKSGPPYTAAVPSGTMVGFCVGAMREPGKPIAKGGPMTSCTTTYVP
jgi:hypothetical protein